MTWSKLDQLMRNGAVLYVDSTFGAWIEYCGEVRNVNLHAARAVLRRDLAVIKEKRSERCYSYRSKYPKTQS